MKVEIKLSQGYTAPTILILTDQMTDKITDLVKQLSEPPPKLIVGYSNNTLHSLEPQQIIQVYTESGKIKAITNDGAFNI